MRAMLLKNLYVCLSALIVPDVADCFQMWKLLVVSQELMQLEIRDRAKFLDHVHVWLLL